MIVVPRDALRRLIATDPGLGDTILAAFMARRSVLLTGASASTRIIGSRFCRNASSCASSWPAAASPTSGWTRTATPTSRPSWSSSASTPTSCPSSSPREPSCAVPRPAALAEYLGLTVRACRIAASTWSSWAAVPPAWPAAVYGASEGLRTLGVEKFGVGGQAGSSSRIENYLGFPTGISGGDLTRRAMIQAEKFGAHLTAPCEATSLREEAGHLILALSDGTEWPPAPSSSPAVPATGASPSTGSRSSRATASTTRPPNGTPPVRRGTGGGRRRWELRRAGGDVPLRRLLLGDDRHPRRRPREEHVPLPHRPHRQPSAHHRADGDARSPGWSATRTCTRSRSPAPTGGRRSPAPGCSPSSGPTRPRLDLRVRRARQPRLRPDGPRPERRGPRRALGRPGPAAAAVRDEPSRAVRRRATCAPAPPSGWRAPSARDRPASAPCTST